MLPAEALTAATINAAYSLNRGHEIGSLEPGKRADFVIHETRDWRELAYYSGIEHPWMVFTRGRIAMERMFT
jgi:imidazolonepropionase